MSQSLVFYSDARATLKRNGFSFKEHDNGFVLRKGSDCVADVEMGAFSAPFLNAWISESIGETTLFPIGFGSLPVLACRGKLAEYSQKFSEIVRIIGSVTPTQADADAVEAFLSDEIVTTGTNAIFRVNPKMIKVVSRVDFEDGGNVSFSDEPEDESDDSEGERATPSSVVKEEVKPFYHVIAMEKKGKIMTKLPQIWINRLQEDGLSWEYDSIAGRLYVSNTKGTALGFPPAPRHLCGLPSLALKLEGKDGGLPEKKEDQLKPLTLTSDSATEWGKITSQFLTTPGMETFRAFRESEIIMGAFNNHKKDAGYKMGSNNKPLSDAVRSVIRGESKAVTWAAFVELLSSTARPNDIKGCMILLFKIRLYVEQDSNGKVYVSE
jgi:hypothetical protein